MMCCDGWSEDCKVELFCPDCGEPVDEEGNALSGCNYSPTTCETCGAAPCDGSC